MCIIIYKPKGATLPLSTLLRAYRRNEDGWGLAAITPSGLDIRRGCGSTSDERLLDAFDELREHELVVHCRIATSGNVDLANTHPFSVVPGVVMFHNGMIDISRDSAPTMCDSFHVAEAIGKSLRLADASEALRDPEYVQSLEQYAGLSRLAFVDSKGVAIVNEDLGFWEDGCWYSNDTARVAEKRSTYGSYHDPYGDGVPEEDDQDADFAFAGKYYDGITPRCYRIETQADEDEQYLSSLALIATLERFDVDEIAQRAYDEPEEVAEAMWVLLQERRVPARLTH